MSGADQYYLINVLVVAGVDLMAVVGLNFQFGVAGINNFALIIFQAAGAYTAAILTLGPSTSNGGFQHYVGGASLPFPLPVLCAGVVGGLLALGVGAVVLRRLRGDYEAIVLLILSLIATGIANSQLNLLNGPSGLANIPQPLSSALGLSTLGYQWVYLAWTAFVAVVIVWAIRRLTVSPFGRSLRAMRDSEVGVIALGRSSTVLRIEAFVIGGIVAGISGGVLVQFVQAWNPGSWLYPETFALLTAIIIGGRGSLRGVLAGTLIVPVLFLEVTRFLPQIGYAGLSDSLAWVCVGLLTITFLWFRPQGLFPERPERFPSAVDMGRSPDQQKYTGAVEAQVTAHLEEQVP